MKRFYILGSNPALSVAEIAAVLGPADFRPLEAAEQVLVTEDAGPAPRELMARLGGTIKIGRLLDTDLEPSADALAELMYEKLAEVTALGGRRTFGFSVYSLWSSARNAAASLKNAGMEAKTRLKEAGIASRWVKAQEGPALTSVAVAKNKLVEEGAEFVVLAAKDRLLIGVTEAVQPFEEFSRQDFGRPSRDTLQGMLPPKVARMMINLAGAPLSGRILDPFCGSGTVLTEALRLGYAAVAGGDKNPAAVKSTTENIDWLRRRQPELSGLSEVFAADARNLAERLAPGSVDAIVTEPFLGPPRRGKETRGELQKTLAELADLYREALAGWRRQLKDGGRVVMVMPIFVIGNEKHGLSVSDLTKRGYVSEPLLDPALTGKLGAKATKNSGLVYGRPDQLVWREIIRLRKTE